MGRKNCTLNHKSPQQRDYTITYFAPSSVLQNERKIFDPNFIPFLTLYFFPPN